MADLKTYHVVAVKQGRLRGVELENVTGGGTYISFRGIPYAAPPVGDLRFKDPQPVEPWTGIRDALREDYKSAQFDLVSNKVIGDDDCLYLHVATTSLTGSRPVMVWIHGGASITGNASSEMYGPDYLVKQDIVFVSMNYRLGVLGYLNLDHEAAPGNMGLKDQVAALKWIKENIAQFGGDTSNITIFGESSGSVSVHLHLISPVSNGLFHKAIMESGVVYNPPARVAKTVEIGRRFAAALGINASDPIEIVSQLRTIPVDKLIAVQQTVLNPEEKNAITFPFGPSEDDKSPTPFMPTPADEVARQGFNVPVLIGYNADEGIAMLPASFPDGNYSKLDENFDILLPHLFKPNRKVTAKAEAISREIRKFYFGDEKITNDSVNEIAQCLGDRSFVTGIHQTVEGQMMKNVPVYLYRFSHVHPQSFAKIFFGIDVKDKIQCDPACIFDICDAGTVHAEELLYLFSMSIFRDRNLLPPNSIEKTVSDRFVRMWTDFAKTGNPTPRIDDLITADWQSATCGCKHYLEINSELVPGVNPNENVIQFWKRIDDMIDHQ